MLSLYALWARRVDGVRAVPPRRHRRAGAQATTARRHHAMHARRRSRGTPATNISNVRFAQLLRRVRHLRALFQISLDVVQQPLGAKFQVYGLLRQLVDARADRPGPVGRHERAAQSGEGQQPPHAAGAHCSLSRRAVRGPKFKPWTDQCGAKPVLFCCTVFVLYASHHYFTDWIGA